MHVFYMVLAAVLYCMTTRDPQSLLTYLWVTVLQKVGRTNQVGTQPATKANSASYPQRGGKWNEYRPKCGDALQLGSKGRMAHSTCTERPRGR